MNSAILIFPGLNRERDAARALKLVSGREPKLVWHADTALPAQTDLVVIPGGFSYGDYLRCGAIAARAPIMQAVRAHAGRGGLVLGICNGFQILLEAGLLPGVMLRNRSLSFVCRDVHVRVENAATPFTERLTKGQVLRLPIAHAEGNYYAGAQTLASLNAENRIVFRYCGPDGLVTPEANPNGSLENIAGIVNAQGNVLGIMPHPERCAEAILGNDSGKLIFLSMLDSLMAMRLSVNSPCTLGKG